MKYAIKLHNMLKGNYEIAIFNKRKEAELAFALLEDLENNDELEGDELTVAYEDALHDSIAYEDDFGYKQLRSMIGKNDIIKDFSYSINTNGHVTTTVSNIRFVYDGAEIDIPA